MRNFEELKELLTEIKGNDYAVPTGVDVDDVIADMLKFIGHTDAELRDKLIYGTFLEWGEYKGIISGEKMKEILATVLSETHLFYRIGETDTDSVFTRAFSSLVIPVAMMIHDENPFLTVKEIHDIKATVIRYVEQEKDYRGFVDGKGWAHSVAHIADAIDHIAYVSDKAIDFDGDDHFGVAGLSELLQAIKLLVRNRDCIYATGEEDRLATAVMSIIWREVLTNEDIIAWIDSFNMSDNTLWGRKSLADFQEFTNCKNFMRSLYFKLLADGDYKEICDHMLNFLVEKDED